LQITSWLQGGWLVSPATAIHQEYFTDHESVLSILPYSLTAWHVPVISLHGQF